MNNSKYLLEIFYKDNILKCKLSPACTWATNEKAQELLLELIQRVKKNMFYDDRISREFYHDTLDKYLLNSKEIIEHVLIYDTFSIIGIVGDKIHINNNYFNYFKEYINQRLNVLCKKISTLEEAFAYFN